MNSKLNLGFAKNIDAAICDSKVSIKNTICCGKMSIKSKHFTPKYFWEAFLWKKLKFP